MVTPEQIITCYERSHGNVKSTARYLSISEEVTVRTLSNHGVWVNDTARRVHELLEAGESPNEVGSIVNLSPAALRKYLPYVSGSYRQRERTKNAENIARWRSMHKPTIAHHIRRAIAHNPGMTQAALSKLLDIDPDALTRMLDSARLPSAAMLARLGAILHCDAAYLANTAPSFLVSVDGSETELCQLVCINVAKPGNRLMGVTVDHPTHGWLSCTAKPFTRSAQ